MKTSLLIPLRSLSLAAFLSAAAAGSLRAQELVVNGNFSNGLTNWTELSWAGGSSFGLNTNGPTDTSAASGNYAYAGGGAYNLLTQDLGLTSGSAYRLTFKAGSQAGQGATYGLLSLRQEALGNYNSASFDYRPSDACFGTYTVDFVADTSTTGLWLRNDGTNSYAAYADVSVTPIGALTNALNYSSASGYTEITSALSGSGKVTVNAGSGGLTFWGANTYTGGTEIAGGTLYVVSGGTLGDATGAIVISNSASTATLDLRNEQTRTGTITMVGQGARLVSGDVNNPGSLVNNGSALEFGGGQISVAVSGTGGLNVTGGGQIFSSNSYTGATVVSGTTGWYGANRLYVSSANGFGDPAGDLTISGGIVNLQTNTVTRSGNVTITGGTIETGTINKSSGSFDIQGGQIAAVLAGAAGLTKSGAGAATLWLSNSYEGATDIQAGTLNLGGEGRLGANAVTISNGASLNFATGQTYLVGNDISGAGQLTQTNNSDTRLIGNVTSTGGLTIHSGIVRIGNGGTTGSYTGDTVVNTAGTLAFDRIDDYTYEGDISGSGLVSKVNDGTVRLTGDSTNFSGTMTIYAGIARIGNGGTTGSFSGNIIVNGSGLLAFDRSDDYTHGAAISGAGTVAKVSAGTVTLSASNSYTGATILYSGTVVAGHPSALGTGNITFSSGGGNTGTIRYTASSAGTDWASRFVSSTGTIRLDTGGNNVSLAGAIDGSNTEGLVKSGDGTLTLSGSIAYAGITAVDAGALVVSNPTLAATIQSASIAVNFAATPALGTYAVLPGPLDDASLVSTSVTGLGAGQTATVTNAPNLVVQVANSASTNNYANWLTNYPSLTGANTNGTADPDGDGFVNDIEYAFDGNPTVGTPALMKVTAVGTNAVLNWIERTNGVVYQLQKNSSLTNAWTNSGVTYSNAPDQSNVLLAPTYIRKQYTTNASGKDFYRVRATTP